jgi:hypothetical protein
MNVNLFWVRSPARELELVRAVLAPEGTSTSSTGTAPRARRSPRSPAPWSAT